jgi:predicted nucleotide-binding protein
MFDRDTALEKIDEIISFGKQHYELSIGQDALAKDVHLLRQKIYNLAEVYFGTNNRFCKSLDKQFDIKMNGPSTHTNMQHVRTTLVDYYLSVAESIKDRIELQPIEENSNDKALLPVDRRKVFVVHGRDEEKRKSLFLFLRSLNLNPIEWDEAVKMTGLSSPYVGEVLDTAFSTAQAIVVLLTPDDEVRLKQELQGSTDSIDEKEFRYQARANVLFEAGMAIARNTKRTIIVQIGSVKSFSDIGGRHIIYLDDTPERRQSFTQRLITAGCDIDNTGTDWLSTGKFE